MSEIIDKIKRWRLKKLAAKNTTPRTFIPLKKASKLAIVYKADQPYSEELLKKVIKFGEQNDIKILALGFVDAKELESRHTPHNNSDFFCKKHLNKIQFPNRSHLERFLTEKQDYLINVYCDACVPLLAVSTMSEAAFRVGPYLPKYTCAFDMMLKTTTSDEIAFLEEVLIYIKGNGNG